MGKFASGHRAERKRRTLRFALGWGVPPIVWQLAFFVGPLLVLVAMSFWSVRNFRITPDSTLANWSHILGAGFFTSAYIYTFLMALITAILASVLAFPASYTIATKARANLRRLLILVLIVPFFTSYPVRIYSWQAVLSPQGIFNSMLDSLGLGQILLLNSSYGTLIGLLTLTMPLVILIQIFALSTVDRRLMEAAHNLGCGRLKTIFTVLLPSARTGLILAGTLAFVLSFGDFVSPTFLGGSRPPTLSIVLTDQVKSGNHWPRASVVAVLMVITLITVVLSMLALAYHKKGGGK
jgi:spermidine/putrescine transport system permease protein